MPFVLVGIAFLMGALPTGYLLGRWLKGVDIRTVGSGNPGATNVFRSVGRGAGIATLAVDIFKGWLPVWLAYRQFPGTTWLPLAAGAAAVAGHTWSPFLNFRGGKGVATSAGVFGALIPGPAACAVAAFAAGLAVSRHVSVGSITAAVVLPVAAFWAYGVSPAAVLAALIGGLVIVKHIPNIRRLARGEELSVAKKPGDQ